MGTIANLVAIIAPESGNARSFAKSSSPSRFTHAISVQRITNGPVLTMTSLGAIFSVKSRRASLSTSVAGPARGAVALSFFRVARQRIGAIAFFGTSSAEETLRAVELAIVARITLFAMTFAVNVMAIASVETETSLGAIDSEETG